MNDINNIYYVCSKRVKFLKIDILNFLPFYYHSLFTFKKGNASLSPLRLLNGEGSWLSQKIKAMKYLTVSCAAQR